MLFLFRWNNLKLKVAQAKQRLGPRIQSEEKAVTAVSYGNFPVIYKKYRWSLNEWSQLLEDGVK